MTTQDVKTPANPSKSAIARVKNPLPVPTECPNCGDPVVAVTNDVVYGGRRYGEWPWIYRCTHARCNSYVGMHPFTNIPLGTLADKQLRDARKAAKDLFNPLWQDGLLTRSQAYAALAFELKVPIEECHFGWFNINQCGKVRKILEKGISMAALRQAKLAK